MHDNPVNVLPMTVQFRDALKTRLLINVAPASQWSQTNVFANARKHSQTQLPDVVECASFFCDTLIHAIVLIAPSWCISTIMRCLVVVLPFDL